ncbi:MAG: hypothetical protein MCS20_01535, partial [Candidatus Phytoplasma mali]|nr:hypothetical protein [Candidatus Phytoplasma australiense]MBZ7920082.1 hypothetical protein [Candidatus Karelsulcia muelleri]MCG7202076.1 hypothetical protein [Candidatus Phytoplasma mali]MCZ8632413.1 hypothetical protein [Spiroplasma sp. Tabriz.8]
GIETWFENRLVKFVYNWKVFIILKTIRVFYYNIYIYIYIYIYIIPLVYYRLIVLVSNITF